MKLLEDRIRKDGTVKEGNILKVDSFLNHQMDIELFNAMGEEFKRLFAVILTDNGVEFKDPDALEHTREGLIRSHLFFCDPQASWQKPHVENNHLLIRRILPKGTSFNSLSLGDVNLICCNINSVLRENLGNRSPFDLMDSADDKKLLSALGLSPIPPDEVILSPKLIKH